MDLFPNYSILG